MMIPAKVSGLPLDITQLEVRFAGLQLPVLSIEKFSLAAGEHLAITGASGSGKSTLVNAITGLEAVKTGKVIWGDTETSSLSAFKRDAFRARNIGLVMQDFHLFAGLSALANVLLPLKLNRGVKAADRERALGLLETVGISRPSQHIETLSRGEMQRVAIARALLAKPGVIVADEPTASLDQKTGADVAELLVRLATEEQATLIVVTHDPQLMQYLQRHIRLEGGKISSDSTKAELP
ncbi:ABC transporter ATP-binding protein [Pseudochrobactrum asaccharolyticum]|uniref:Putative ABC transport system ATP-binding protein n=2 Tax=Brucellaceae TaxID=118882 RepID=A0A366DZQ3_9HYPH|nr:ATP-binding cassette domain-containing protein [Pseudochrobactrum asaccharolyticum]MBX8800281.1 ATP-binding cassette domain-containing protein [Ochrobactrum sp. MR28]MBX8815893.1 ATP-binding cassette domain-containing protein [Ochrobactrum sp. MR31]RBO95543.1 putative ABC transport system ATP-binding protein [Pseudochrobactrum asaccharolyticum]